MTTYDNLFAPKVPCGRMVDVSEKVVIGRHVVTTPRVPWVSAMTTPVTTCDDPAAPYATKRARRAAWEAWEQAGEPWPPPAGLVSATLDACRGNGANRDRWKR